VDRSIGRTSKRSVGAASSIHANETSGLVIEIAEHSSSANSKIGHSSPFSLSLSLSLSLSFLQLVVVLSVFNRLNEVCQIGRFLDRLNRAVASSVVTSKGHT